MSRLSNSLPHTSFHLPAALVRQHHGAAHNLVQGPGARIPPQPAAHAPGH